MQKTVQIDRETFFKLVRYFYIEYHDEELYKAIQSDIEAKIEKMVKHELYTTSKVAPTEEEREKARQEYLDKIGMHKDFRW